MSKHHPIRPREDFDRDLGLGARLADRRGTRILNHDGTFNVRRKGQRMLESLNFFHWILNLPGGRFMALVALAYTITNSIFALGYYACGPAAFAGASAIAPRDRFIECFFFSVQTLATIGYGRVSPVSIAANLLVTLESLTGLMGIALVTGIVFSRFSRPTAEVIFSKHAVIAPYQGLRAFMFRIVNGRSNQLISVQAVVNMGRIEEDGKRNFYTLALERKLVTFFPLHWVVVHPIDEESPLYGWTAERLAASDAEFTILLTAIDETFSQTVNARSSYKHSEIVWGAKFKDMFLPAEDGVPAIDLRLLGDIEPAPLAPDRV